MEKMIRQMDRRQRFKGKKVYLFGVSDNTRQIVQMLRRLDIEPVGILDNDLTKQGSHCGRIMVYPVYALRDGADGDAVVLVYSFSGRR